MIMMNYIELAGVIIAFLALVGGLIMAWTNLNTKLTSLDAQLTGLKAEMKEFKDSRAQLVSSIQTSNNTIWGKLDEINDRIAIKIDTLTDNVNVFHLKFNEEFTKLKTEHNLCNYKSENKNNNK